MSRPGEPVALAQRRLELERIRYCHEAFVSRFEWAEWDGQSWLRDEFSNAMVRRGSAEFAGRKVTIEREVSVSVPADWWQHLKDRWFPRWALARWPVRIKTHVLALSADATALFPEVEPFRAHYTVIAAFDRVDWRAP